MGAAYCRAFAPRRGSLSDALRVELHNQEHSSGVPMLGWPRLSDQNTNSHYVTSVWEVSLELRRSIAEDRSAVVLKAEIDQKVKKIMGDVSETENLEVSEIRRNTRNCQVAAMKAAAKGGSSRVALAEFVELISSCGSKVKIDGPIS